MNVAARFLFWFIGGMPGTFTVPIPTDPVIPVTPSGDSVMQWDDGEPMEWDDGEPMEWDS